MGRIKILVIYKQNRSFVHEDIALLKKHFDVDSCQYTGIGSLWTIWKKVRKADVIYIWFASYHAFLTTLLSRKPKIIVTGGYDVAGEKAINYGLMLSPIWKQMVKFTLKRAQKIICVSAHNKKDLIKHLQIYDATVIYNSVDPEKFYPQGKKNNNLVITVGFINEETWVRKGFQKFAETARKSHEMNDDLQFIAIGKVDEKMKEKTAQLQKEVPNLSFAGFVSDEELLKAYQQAKVYCQLSYYESYGIAPAEAMLCGCIPVVTNRSALPEVVGDVGYKVPYGDIDEIYRNIKAAAKAKREEKVRKHIIEKFPFEKREKELVKMIEDL